MKKLIDTIIPLENNQMRFWIKRKGQVNTANNFFNVFRDNEQVKMLMTELLDRNMLLSNKKPFLVHFAAKRTTFTIALELIKSNIPECDYQIFIRAFYLNKNLPGTILNQEPDSFVCYDLTDFEIPFLIKPRQGDQKEGPFNHEEILFHFWTSKHVLEMKNFYAKKFNLQRAVSDIMKHLITTKQLEQFSDSFPFHIAAKELQSNSDAKLAKLIFSASITKGFHNEKTSYNFLIDDIELDTSTIRELIKANGENILDFEVELTTRKSIVLQERPKGLKIVKKVER